MYGQMNEPPGARARVALTGLTVAEYFRDEEGQDVLLFIDNIFRFTQAGSEVCVTVMSHNYLCSKGTGFVKKPFTWIEQSNLVEEFLHQQILQLNPWYNLALFKVP